MQEYLCLGLEKSSELGGVCRAREAGSDVFSSEEKVDGGLVDCVGGMDPIPVCMATGIVTSCRQIVRVFTHRADLCANNLPVEVVVSPSTTTCLQSLCDI